MSLLLPLVRRFYSHSALVLRHEVLIMKNVKILLGRGVRVWRLGWLLGGGVVVVGDLEVEGVGADNVDMEEWLEGLDVNEEAGAVDVAVALPGQPVTGKGTTSFPQQSSRAVSFVVVIALGRLRVEDV
ncbi:hypothetical protein BDN72DRAFT_863537 [Pluteus cervinus]|uniref:Uncharacterized protein n=1 Tax=Pluteus cervinus TaxID=181527 RepID=A0ACD3A768_9AGAR|nr:hypothetical protein BDN72DRAFT_863537 [Pluteus cervinus]